MTREWSTCLERLCLTDAEGNVMGREVNRYDLAYGVCQRPALGPSWSSGAARTSTG